MLQEATNTLFKDDELPTAAKDTTYVKRTPTRQLGSGQKSREVERAQTPNKQTQAIMQSSNMFSGDENPTFMSTNDIAKQTNFSVVKLLDAAQRSSSVQPPQAGGLPSIGNPKLAQIQTTKNQAMVYNRNFVLNIDNTTTNRNNKNYISGYYKQLSDASVIPQAIAQKSLRSLEYTSPMRSTSMVPHATDFKVNQFRLLNDNSAELTLAESLKQQTQRFQPLLPEGSRTIQHSETKLPNLFADNSIVSCLNQGIQVSARAKAAILFGETERRRHRKDVTKQLIGMPDYQSQASVRPFKPKGTLEQPEDGVSQSVQSDSLVNTSVFNVMEDNYSDYIRELEDQKQQVKQQNLKVRNTLLPSERLKFDQDEEFARQAIINAQKQREEDGEKASDEIIEPERNIEKLRARIQIKAIKKFTEDEKLLKETEQKAALAAKIGDEGQRLTSAQKNRRKHEPIKRRRSFTETQIKYEENLPRYDPNMVEKLTLTDKNTITKMTLSSRFPIPEALMNMPLKYWLKIDSVCHNFYNVESLMYTSHLGPDLKAPKNSDVSSDNLSIGADSEDEETQILKRKAIEEDPDFKSDKPKPFDKTLVDLQPWNIEKLLVFPHKARDGEFPLRLLNKAKVDYLVIVAKTLEEYQKDKKYQYSLTTVQTIFLHYCSIFKVQPLDITDYIVPCENNRIKFSMRHNLVTENLAKAVACTIPFIYGIYEVEFVNNQVVDMISPLLIMAAFVNPSVRRYSYCANAGRATFKKTYQELVKAWDMKFIEINLTRSIQHLETLEQMTRSFSVNLFKLNISGCTLSINATRIMSVFLLKQQYIKDLNLAKCRLDNQSARYIIDALNRNVTIRHLNLSYNDLGSSIYEFSIKISSMLTRQPTLMHADLSQCGFKREECMFIILAMSTSKNFLSLHMTGNELPYYERVFMRSLIAARVQFSSKTDQQRQEIKVNKERYQVMQLAKQQHYSSEIKDYLETFDKLDDARQGLDFEIEDLLKEVDVEKQFLENQGATVDGLPEGSKLQLLIGKMMERNKDLTEQQDQVKEIMKLSAPEIRERLKRMNTESVLNQNANKQGNGLQAAFDAKNELKKERQRQRAELDAAKGKKERSAGEMALLFMGINQQAFDLLLENPMSGYMNEIIYTRILGHDEIEQGQFWADATLCYICQKWEKQTITFDPKIDDSKWSQRITQVNHLQNTIDNLYSNAQEVELVKQAEKAAEFQQLKEFERKRRIALGEESDDKPEIQNGGKSDQPKTESAAEQNDRVMRQASSTKLRINLIPAMNHSAQSTLQLKTVGPESLSPRFGGLQGLTPGGKQVRQAQQGSDSITPRYKAASSIDNGQYSYALDRTPVGMELELERLDTPLEKVTRPARKAFNSENPLIPRNINIKQVQANIFPEQFVNANDFLELHLRHSNPGTPEEGSRPIGQANHDKYMAAKQLSRYGGPPGGMPGLQNQAANKRKLFQKQPSLKDLTQDVIKASEKVHQRPASHHSQAPSIITNIQQPGDRKRGQPQKIQRTLFFGGMVYVIEEEVYSDSDNSSVYTSEDDFEEEKHMSRHYIAMTDDYNARMADEAEALKQQLLNPQKTIKEIRLEKLGIVEDAKKVLSEAQKAYKTKIWPRHYIPERKERNAMGIDSVGQELDLKISNEDNTQIIKSGPLDQRPVIYLVGSFNDWMPVKLKTKRELTMEKINPDEPIPKSVFVLENTLLLHANYMSPGKHYFYFVREEGTIILSPKYEIVRFKATNVFLNQVTVRPRIYDFDAVNVVRGGDDEEQVFLKDKSVFRDFKDDTRQSLKKSFEQDFAYTKIQRTVKGEDEGTLDDIKELLLKHFVRINNIFLYYIGISTYPTIGMNDFTSWANKCEIIDGKQINLATLDRILITTNVALHGLISSAERDLNRYEFLEVIVRLAIAKYRENKVCDSTPQAVLKLLQENIFKNSLNVDGDNFRRFQCYNVKVNEILQKNLGVLKKIYDSYTHQKKKFIRLDECREYILKSELKVSQMQTGVIFSESMMMLVDTIIDQQRPNQMKFVEFLVFLCRCAFEHYNGTPYENEMMYLKLEKLIPQMLQPLNLQPLFLFYEEFEYKPMQKKVKKPKKIIVVSEDGSQQEEQEEESEDEESSEDDLGECVVLEEGKYQLSHNYMLKMQREKQEKAGRRAEKELARQKKQEARELAEQERKLKRAEMDLLSDGADDRGEQNLA